MSLTSKSGTALPPLSAESPILGVDLDNVLASTYPLIRRLIGVMFDVLLEQREIVHFDYWLRGITKEQDRIVLARFHAAECENVTPSNEAVDAMRSLSDRFEIQIVTGRPAENSSLTVNWLKKHKRFRQ